jgi:hypothetical protein
LAVRGTRRSLEHRRCRAYHGVLSNELKVTICTPLHTAFQKVGVASLAVNGKSAVTGWKDARVVVDASPSLERRVLTCRGDASSVATALVVEVFVSPCLALLVPVFCDPAASLAGQVCLETGAARGPFEAGALDGVEVPLPGEGAVARLRARRGE